MYSTNHGFHTYDHMLFDGENGTESFSPEYFAEYSEHIVLSTATDGSEVGYVNHTECFGGTFTGI